MDTDCVDYSDYHRCLRDLSRVNIVTFTHRPMLTWLRRRTERMPSFSLLDVACGYGDALRQVHRWADRRGLEARLEGIDLNPWATRAAREAATTPITYRTGDAFTIDPNETFDFIISSQFTHHLTDDEIVGFIRWMEMHARHGWFIADLHRHWLPYYGFGVLAWLARWHHFVLSDGRISIARAFVPADWRRLVRQAGLAESDVAITWHVPFRLCVARR
ncbi:MAG TPA: methyltransferase domain-containing protein [Acetobacteraceae bacterium]|jgi:2-polyprenyl-3-methyl-5-hydroxy-6-metoxy-1,4-benzoquinol methylase|nr:methyltransferase domain-containing protein [Acetobacteraceae bacterium]